MKDLLKKMEETHEWVASTKGQKHATVRMTADEIQDLLRAIREQVARDLANELPRIYEHMLR